MKKYRWIPTGKPTHFSGLMSYLTYTRLISGVSYLDGFPVGETSWSQFPRGARGRWRGTGPRPTVKGAVFFVARGPVPRERHLFIVARGPVPRERWIARAMARETRSHARMACEGPSPTVRECRFFIVARGPVPRDRHRYDGCSPRCSLRSSEALAYLPSDRKL